MSYEDFALRIIKLKNESEVEDEGSRYITVVNSARIGNNDIVEEFIPPFSKEEIEGIDEIFAEIITNHRPGTSPKPLTKNLNLLQQKGRLLYKALLNYGFKELYDNNTAYFLGTGKKLRLMLQLDRTLANFPWEFLYGNCWPGRDNEFFVRDSNISLARYIPVRSPCEKKPIEGPLKILIVISDPYHDDPEKALDTVREKQRLQNNLKPLIDGNLLEIGFIEGDSTLIKLGQYRGYHIIHYIGHGGYDSDGDVSYLLFEGPNGNPMEVEGNHIVETLASNNGMSSLRLFVLNACKGARVPISEDFTGIAESLVRNGVPAVVAMRYEITDIAAPIFSEGFYSALMTGGSVDDAISFARRNLAAYYIDTLEWLNPVLYLGTNDGTLFDIPKDRAEQMNQWLENERKIENVYKRGLSSLDNGNFHQAIKEFQEINGIRPNYRNVTQTIDAINNYEQAASEIENKAYRKALELIEKVEKNCPALKGIVELHEKAQREFERLEELFQQGQAALSNGDFTKAMELFVKIETEDPEYPELQKNLRNTQEALNNLGGNLWNDLIQKRAEAEQFEGVRKWKEATQTWKELELMAEKFYHDKPANIDARRLWEEVQEKAQLGELYEGMRKLYEHNQWDPAQRECIELMKKIPEGVIYRDVDEFDKKIRRKLEEAERKKKAEEEAERESLAELYADLLKAEKQKLWDEVISICTEIEEIDSNYRDTAKKKKDAQTVKNIEAQIQILPLPSDTEVLKEMYLKARAARSEKKWQEVADTCNKILQRNPGHQEALNLRNEAEEIIEMMNSIQIDKE